MAVKVAGFVLTWRFRAKHSTGALPRQARDRALPRQARDRGAAAPCKLSGLGDGLQYERIDVGGLHTLIIDLCRTFARYELGEAV